VESDPVGQLEFDALARRSAVFVRTGVEAERNEQGRLRAGGRRSSGQSSLPGVEGGTGDPFTGAERGDREAALGLPLEASPPGVFEVGVFGACHGLTPGLVARDQPSRIATVARLDLASAYTVPHTVRIFLHADAVDLRKGFDGLSGLVSLAFPHEELLSGHLFLFLNG
jgi:hypothetical protein